MLLYLRVKYAFKKILTRAQNMYTKNTEICKKKYKSEKIVE